MKTNYHAHSTFCDGAGTPEEMVVSALERGFATLGFSSHSDMVADLAAYKAEIRCLKEKYAPEASIHCEVSGLDAAIRGISFLKEKEMTWKK